MNLILFLFSISYRFAIPNKHQNKSKFLSWFSIIGLTMGVSILIVVMSIMNGFDNELKERVLTISPHIKLIASNNHSLNRREDELILQNLQNMKNVTRAVPFIEKMSILSKDNQYHAVNLICLNFNLSENIDFLSEYIVRGDLQNIIKNEYSIIIGNESALKLGVSTGDKIKITLPDYKLSPMGYITREKTFEVISIFKIGTSFDFNSAFINLPTAQKFFRLDKNIDGYHINLNNYLHTNTFYNFKDEITSLKNNNNDFQIKYWQDENSTLFNAIYMEKTLIFILLTAVIAIASFNIISVLLMNVIERKSEISILRSLGFSSRNIVEVFVLQGLLIGMIGVIFGVGIGLFVSIFINDILMIFENIFSERLFDPSLYYISYLPIKIDYLDCMNIVIVSIIICLISTLYPAIMASKIQPSKSLVDNN